MRPQKSASLGDRGPVVGIALGDRAFDGRERVAERTPYRLRQWNENATRYGGIARPPRLHRDDRGVERQEQ